MECGHQRSNSRNNVDETNGRTIPGSRPLLVYLLPSTTAAMTSTCSRTSRQTHRQTNEEEERFGIDQVYYYAHTPPCNYIHYMIVHPIDHEERAQWNIFALTAL